MIWVDAEQSYEGEWQNGIQCGLGTAKWHGVRNAEYTGSWKNGQRDGIGAMTYGDGSYYNGEWKEDKKWGEAEVVSTNGYKEAPILFEVKYSLHESKNLFLFFIFDFNHLRVK